MSLNLNAQLLGEIFESVTDEIRVLEPVHDKDNVIIDFKYVTGVKPGHDTTGHDDKLLLPAYPWRNGKTLFHHFTQALDNNTPFDIMFETGENSFRRWYHIKGKKFNSWLILFLEDVTLSKLSEEKIMQLNKALFSKNRQLEALGSELKTFNTIAANDYNETLKHLYNSMEFIITNDAKNLSDAGRANIRRAQAAIQKMKLLTDDIVAFSKINSEEQMIQVNLNDQLSLALHALDEKIRAEGAEIRSDSLPVVQGYPTLISLLFYHLVSNAVKFRKEDLPPFVEIRHAVQRGFETEHAAAIADISYNVVSVVDNGVGFDPAEHENIFTIFHRLHEKGKQKGGIGLAICKKIMDLHGGFIVSECTPECTTFRSYFPIQKAGLAI